MIPLKRMKPGRKTCLMQIGRKIHRKAIGHIKQWVDNNIFHVSNKTNVCTLWKKLEERYEKKKVVNQTSLIRKLVNMKFEEGGLIEDHIY